MSPSRAAPLSVLLAGCLLSTSAIAQSSPYYIGVSQTLSHESNLLRLSTRQVAPAGYSKSDTLSSTALVAGLDQPIGRQRLYGSARLRADRFNNNKIYDNEGYTLSGGLDFSTIERISGSVYASANRGLSRFNTEEIGLLTDKNEESVELVGANLRVGVVTAYTFEVSGSHRRVDNSLDDDRVQARNFRQDSASVGVRWRPSPSFNLGVSLRGSKGTYPQFRRTLDGGYQADRFERQDVELTMGLQPSGNSRLDLSVSDGKTEFDLATQRDFSGLTGSLSWRWQATGKLVVHSRYTRDTGQDSYAGVGVFNLPVTTDYSRTTDILSVGVQWAYSAKVAFDASTSHTDRRLVRTIDNLLFPSNATGRDKVSALKVGGRWTPVRWAQVGCSVEGQRRNGSGQLGSDLRAETYSCFGQFTLQ